MYLTLLSAQSIILMLAMSKLEDRQTYVLQFIFILIISFILGFRYEIGVDWGNNSLEWIELLDLSFSELVSIDRRDKGYRYLIWFFGGLVGVNIYIFNFLIISFYIFSLQSLSKKIDGKIFAALAAFPYLTVVVAQGYIKQIIAISIVFYTLALIERLKWKKTFFSVAVILATTIHTPCIILLPLILFWNKRSWSFNILLAFLGILGVFFVYILFDSFQSVFTRIAKQYFYLGYYSGGVYLRAAIFFFNFIIFLFYFKLLDPSLRRFLLFSFLFFSLLYSSVLFLGPLMQIDRLGLYSYLFQILALTKIFSKLEYKNKLIMSLGYVLFSLMQLLAWKYLATFSCAWYPYRSYIWTLFYPTREIDPNFLCLI